MKRILSLLMVVSMMVLSASEVVPLDKEVVGVNKEQIEERNVDSADIKVNKSSVNSSSSEKFQGGSGTSADRISVIQTDKGDLEKEVSSKSEKKGGGAKWIIGVLGVAALIIAL